MCGPLGENVESPDEHIYLPRELYLIGHLGSFLATRYIILGIFEISQYTVEHWEELDFDGIFSSTLNTSELRWSDGGESDLAVSHTCIMVSKRER